MVASGLQRPTGIAIRGSDDLYFTELPTPGVAGPNGGTNRVSRLDLDSGEIENITTGEPEPTNLAVASDGDVYWTCKSAGVILRLMEDSGVSLFASNLNAPSGITVFRRNTSSTPKCRRPGVPGSQGGRNNVSAIHGFGKFVINAGEPEPVDVVVSRRGDLYWTCKTAGVILRRSIADRRRGAASDRPGRRRAASRSTTRARRWSSPKCRRPGCPARRAAGTACAR